MAIPVVDHESIRQSEDRSWSEPLLHAFLESNAKDDLDDVILTLQMLDDYRVVTPLLNLLHDLSADSRLRKGASEILSGCTMAETSDDRRTWWASNDPLFMRLALRSAERSEMDIVEKVASNANHPFYIDALKKLGIRFEEPRFQLLKINALADARADVREMAAYAILWDQPISAETDLLKLAQAEDEPAATEALEALAYYGSQNTLISIYRMKQNGSAARREQYTETLKLLSDEFIRAFRQLENSDAAAALYFKSWLAPSWEILEIAEEAANVQKKLCAESPSTNISRTKTVQISEIIETFSNVNRAWADRWELMNKVDWIMLSQPDQSKATKYFSEHPDWSVRECACSALADMDASDALFAFLDDPVVAVRQAASYYIREVPQEDRIGNRLWHAITTEQIAGTHASEALESFVAHSKSDQLEHLLVDLAKGDERESIKTTAISQLLKLKSRKSIQSLLPLLDDQPLVTWAAHTRLLDACLKLNITVPNLDRFKNIDDLYIQESLASLVAATNR